MKYLAQYLNGSRGGCQIGYGASFSGEPIFTIIVVGSSQMPCAMTAESC